jgi:hypothetical protein
MNSHGLEAYQMDDDIDESMVLDTSEDGRHNRLGRSVEIVRKTEMRAKGNNRLRNDHHLNGRKMDRQVRIHADVTEQADTSSAPVFRKVMSVSAERPAGEPHRSALFHQNATLREDNEKLRDEIKRLQSLQAAGAVQAIAAELSPSNNGIPPPSPKEPTDSEGRLRIALTRKGTTTTELKQAILAVESLVDEARRELGQAMLRERRAAFEALHHAIDRGDEETLEFAIEKARLAEVEDEDISKGEAKLTELRSMTPEQRAKKLAREVEAKSKKESFILIKRDDVDGLNRLIDGLAQEVRWKDWKDYAGRSMWRCSIELKASRVQRFLAPLVGQKLPEDTKRRSSTIVSGEETASDKKRPSLDSPSNAAHRASLGAGGGRRSLFGSRQVSGESFVSEGSGGGRESTGESPALAPKSPGTGEPKPDPFRLEQASNDFGSPMPSSSALEATESSSPEQAGTGFTSPTRSESEYAQIKMQAFRAVAQDDTESLADVLVSVHQDIWTKWQNKASKDLLTLSTERGSSGAYSMLARELGMLKETVRDTFEERESVWVFEPGEVQPRRATVLEDTSTEPDDVLVEFWDGDEPASRIDRCLIHKIQSF